MWSRPRPRCLTDQYGTDNIEWWTLLCSCVTSRYPGGEGYSKIGKTISQVVKPYGGWMSGFVPKIEQGDTCLNFSLVWPRFV